MIRSEEEAMTLYNNNQGLIYTTILRKYNDFNFRELHGLDKDDIIQYGKMGLYRACHEYDPTKGTKFSSFAISNIQWSILTEAKRDSLGSNGKWTFDLVDRTSLDKVLYYDSHGLEVNAGSFIEVEETGFEDVIVNDFIDSIGKTVSEKVAQMVRMRVEGDTYTEIGKYMGSSRQNVISMLKYHREKIISLLPAS